jgi:hypothetical protein
METADVYAKDVQNIIDKDPVTAQHLHVVADRLNPEIRISLQSAPLHDFYEECGKYEPRKVLRLNRSGHFLICPKGNLDRVNSDSFIGINEIKQFLSQLPNTQTYVFLVNHKTRGELILRVFWQHNEALLKGWVFEEVRHTRSQVYS